MSYDICLNDPKTGCVITFDEPIPVSGGTFALGGTRDAWLNITYNYGSHYRRVMGEKGIRTVYGMTGKESLPVLDAAIDALGDDVSLKRDTEQFLCLDRKFHRQLLEHFLGKAVDDQRDRFFLTQPALEEALDDQ